MSIELLYCLVVVEFEVMTFSLEERYFFKVSGKAGNLGKSKKCVVSKNFRI